jgi:thiamine kinase-like enzyme
MDRRAVVELEAREVADHPSVQAWLEACPGGHHPMAITALKAQVKASHKSGVYRLIGAGADGRSNVIAKRCVRRVALFERLMYTEVLPALGIPSLRFYGLLDEPQTRFAWHFTEDAGEQRCGAAQQDLAARWLAKLHASAASLDGNGLPDCGVSLYREHLDQAVRSITEAQAGPVMPASPPDRATLAALLESLDIVRQRWPSIETWTAQMPRTIVHGDFVPKNVRLRGDDVYVLDWETAGFGVPVADLASLATESGTTSPQCLMEDYLSVAGPLWGNPSTIELDRCARLGILFRLLASVNWAAQSLTYSDLGRPMGKLRVYAPRLDNVLQTLDWENSCLEPS